MVIKRELVLPNIARNSYKNRTFKTGKYHNSANQI